MGNFERCLPIILQFEGGYANNPRDPGGATNFGITQRVYDGYRSRKGMQQRDVRSITQDEVTEIYRTSYWDLIRGDSLPDGVDLATFDGAVNSGVAMGAKWLQRAAGVTDDGVIGPATIAAASNYQDKAVLINSMIDKREAFLHSLSTFSTFGAGWLNRTHRLRGIALSWVSAPMPAAMPMAPPAPNVPMSKADPADMKTAPPAAPGDAVTGAGIGSMGVSGTLNSLHDQLAPYAWTSGWVAKVVIGLAIIGAILTIGGLAWGWYARTQKAKLAGAGA